MMFFSSGAIRLRSQPWAYSGDDFIEILPMSFRPLGQLDREGFQLRREGRRGADRSLPCW